MPFCPLFLEQFNKVAKVKDFKKSFKKDPFVAVNKYYPTVEPVESKFLQPREINKCLLDEVDEPKLQKEGASGLEAKLRTTLPEGQQELAASSACDQAASVLRLTNSQELTIQALSVVTQSMATHIDQALSVQGVPQEARQHLKALQSSVQTLVAGKEDLEHSNGYLAQCSLFQHTNALRTRQKAWLSATSLPSALQQEVLRSDLQTSPSEGFDNLLLVGDRGAKLIEDHFQKKHDDRFRDWKTQLNKADASAKAKGKGKKQKKSKTKQPQQLSSAAEQAGWSTQYFDSGRGGRGSRGGSRGGRGGGGGGRGQRGGFSKASASQSFQ